MATQAKGKSSEDQGFNDAELEDIMNEIENLEKEFSDDEPVAKKKAIDPIEEEMLAAAGHAEDSEDEVIEVEEAQVVNIRPEMPKVVKNTPTVKPKPVEVSSKNQMTVPTRMNFSVSGEMSMELNFEIGEQNIQLLVDPVDGLVISMGSGAKFCLPLNGKSAPAKKTGT